MFSGHGAQGKAFISILHGPLFCAFPLLPPSPPQPNHPHSSESPTFPIKIPHLHLFKRSTNLATQPNILHHQGSTGWGLQSIFKDTLITGMCALSPALAWTPTSTPPPHSSQPLHQHLPGVGWHKLFKIMSLEEEPLRTGFPDCSAYPKAHLRKECVVQFAKLFFVTGSEQPLSMFFFVASIYEFICPF